jgi:hypothetical protein
LATCGLFTPSCQLIRQLVVHTATCTWKVVQTVTCTWKVVHTGFCTMYIQTFVHTATCTRKVVHTGSFTYRQLCTTATCTWKVVHTGSCKCKEFYLKGQCHEIFRFWFFSSISFPPAPEYPIRTVSNFFRKFAEIFAAQGCQISSIRTILIILLGQLWIVELTHIYIFVFKFTLRYLQPDINPIVCHRCQQHRWQICGRCR